jgi:hypothetical protein
VGLHPITRSGTASAGTSAGTSGPSADAPSAGPSELSAAALSALDASLRLMSLALASLIVTSVVVASWMMASFVGSSDRTSIALASMVPLSVRTSADAPPAGPPASPPAIPPPRPPVPPVDASLDPPCPALPPVDEEPLSEASCPCSKPSRSLQDADGRAVPHTAKIHPARRSNDTSFSSSGGRGGSSLFFGGPRCFGSWLGRLFRNGFVRAEVSTAFV